MKNTITVISNARILFYALITSLIEFGLTVLGIAVLTWGVYQITGLHTDIPFWFIIAVVGFGYFFVRGIISLFINNVKFVEDSVKSHIRK